MADPRSNHALRRLIDRLQLLTAHDDRQWLRTFAELVELRAEMIEARPLPVPPSTANDDPDESDR